MTFRRCAGVAAMIVATTMTVSMPFAYADPVVPAAPVAEAFTLPELIGPYPSDLPARGTYIGVLDGFTEIRDTRPDLIRSNLDLGVEINNAATPLEQQRALFDHNHDRLLSLSDGLGDGLGALFRTALDDHRLPKVQALLAGDIARAGGIANSTLLEKEHWSNPRPFELAPERIVAYRGDGISGAADPFAEVYGTDSYPSGHAAQAYWKGILLAGMLPELAPQILTRASEIGNGRIVLGVHYPLDIMGGRIMGQAAAADRLNDPAFARLLDEAGTELRAVLEAAAGMPLGDYIATDRPYRSADTARAEFTERLTYGFEQLHPDLVNDIPAEAAVLLRAVAPELTDRQRLDVLRRTAIPAGYPLDRTGPDGGWLRIDLVAAYEAVGAR
ncbi:acid phosphatase [Rhodococcus phenolicus]|uniref:acid phosphatase n=1 Tax=Rhodococcus phenolicus TaxID=263849 RepID=UPI00083665BE|nr:phosphatase PAP2 family protein [Rhodococcus phenolicus]